MIETSLIANIIFQNGSGFVFQTLFSDLLFGGIILYVITAVIVPVLRPVMRTVIAIRHVANEIEGPKPHWLYGNLDEYSFSQEGMLKTAETTKQYPAMCILYRSILGVVVTYHPDVAKKILSPSYPKSIISEVFLKIAFREGLVTSAGELWKRHRRLLTPVFHHGILKGYSETFSKNCQIFLNACEGFSQTGKPCDITEPLAHMTHTNMMECIMSQTDDDNSGMRFNHVEAQHMSSVLIKRCENPLLWIDSLFFLSKEGRKFRENFGRFEDVVAKIIKERRALLASIQGQGDLAYNNVFTDEATGKSHTFRKHKGKDMDFLDILIQTKDEDGKGLSDEEVFDEVANFFLAGQETVTTALSWILYYLSINEDYQERCRSEIDEVLGQKEECEHSDLSKLIYVTQCIKEGMRIAPAIPTVARSLSEDLTVSHRFNDYKEITIKKGTTVAVNVFALHRNPHVWESPEVYDPERFSPENISKIEPFAYLPFVAGPRNCIGQSFAMNEMKISLANILRRYKFVYPPNTPAPRMKVGITLSPENGVPLIVKSVKV